MKIRFIAVAMGLSLALSAARANDILAITETGENFNDLVVTFNGAPLAGVQITGAADNWTVELPSGYSWPSFVGNGFQFGEPDNALSNNQLLFSQPTFLIWQSDIFVGFPSTPGPMNIGAIGIGPTRQPFDVVVNDTNGVPDSGLTAMLLTVALSGLGLARQFGSRPSEQDGT